jgi:hypothetical protein
MAHFDVFQSSAFEMAELTEAINKRPYQPGLLGSLGLFRDKPVSVEVVTIEEKNNTLALLPISAKGTVGAGYQRPRRNLRDFRIPHVPSWHTLRASDIQNIRAFGSESELEAVGSVVLEVLDDMRAWHETTMEWHRIGAIKGEVLDADATTVVYNFFTEFGTSETVVTFDMTPGAVDIQLLCHQINREMASALGSTPFSGILALCGDRAFDSMINHASVQAGYVRWNESEFFRQNFLGPEWQGLGASGFSFGGINWLNYRGTVGDVNFIDDAVARFVPMGTNMFVDAIGPADFMEAANTRGQRLYMKQEALRFNKGIEFHGQSNILSIPQRPKALIKGNFTNIQTIVPASLNDNGEIVIQEFAENGEVKSERVIVSRQQHVAKPGDQVKRSQG